MELALALAFTATLSSTLMSAYISALSVERGTELGAGNVISASERERVSGPTFARYPDATGSRGNDVVELPDRQSILADLAASESFSCSNTVLS